MGDKEKVKFQIWRRMDIPAHKRANIPNWIKRNHSDMIQKVPGACIVLKVREENTRYHIAKKIADTFGFGQYNVMAYDWHLKNKKFSKQHECPIKHHNNMQGCKFYTNKKCRRYRVYKKGEKCDRNKYYAPNWQVYARVDIIPSDNLDGFSYYFDRDVDKLERYDWFLTDA